MKKNIFLLVLVFLFIKLSSQNYFTINFEGNGASPETVRIDNLTQGTNLTINGNDVLHLVYNSTGIYNNNLNSSKLNIFPNPMMCSSNLQFENSEQGNVIITIYNITGKKVISYSKFLAKGAHAFILSDFPAGSYIYNIQTQSNIQSGTFNSINNSESSPSVKLNSDIKITQIATSNNSTNNKNNKAIVEMNYTLGDALKFTGSATGFEEVIIYNTPNSDNTFIFNFNTIFICGNTVTDSRDSIIYNTVQIGSQCWFAENLKYLPSVIGHFTGSDTIPCYYVYGYDGNDVNVAKATSNYSTYGVLYNWSAAMEGSASSTANPSGVKGVCPTGWHLPSDNEWTQLATYLGGTSIAGGKLKEAGTTHWDSPNVGATNSSGFTALPGGSSFNGEVFSNIVLYGFWRCATMFDDYDILYWHMTYGSTLLKRFFNTKKEGYSVRCLKD